MRCPTFRSLLLTPKEVTPMQCDNTQQAAIWHDCGNWFMGWYWSSRGQQPTKNTSLDCMTSCPSLISAWKGRIYLPRNIPGEITVGRELELAGLFGPVIHNLNVPRLQKNRHSNAKSETNKHTKRIMAYNSYLSHCVNGRDEKLSWDKNSKQHDRTSNLKLN